MNLKRQLLLVSLLTLVLPWAGYQFIHETESALRKGQQQMLAGTARAIADSLAQYRNEFPDATSSDYVVGDQLYGHRLARGPEIDGYFDDWALRRESLRVLRGVDGPVYFAVGIFDEAVYLYVEASDRNVVYAQPGTIAPDDGPRFADRVSLISMRPPDLNETIGFAAEAPGQIVAYVQDEFGFRPDATTRAFWQDVPQGFQIEARIPASRLGTHLGLVVSNSAGEFEPPVISRSFAARMPGPFVTPSTRLIEAATARAQDGMRLLVTDRAGWRIGFGGDLAPASAEAVSASSAWLRIAYDALVESGAAAALAQPDPAGREQQAYIRTALDGTESVSWFRSPESGRAIVAVAAPIKVDRATIGAVVLQQGTDEILSLTNQGLVRLMNFTLIATLLVAVTLLGYATWLSRRIRRLSVAAEAALDGNKLSSTLPSANAGDEVGDLSRSFSQVLRQLGDYNDYLRTLASKLSHELRTPLAIVTSSLENLDHEPLNETSQGYAARAREGADRLRRILTAMSEASRVEELMEHADTETFDLAAALRSTVAAYRDIYPGREIRLETELDTAMTRGAPELIIQMLDKLVDNAVDFSAAKDTITVGLQTGERTWILTVANPGPPLPEQMRSQLFDSMVSVRRGGDDKHLGLGLYVAKLIVEGHRGTIEARNSDGGVIVTVTLPGESNGE